MSATLQQIRTKVRRITALDTPAKLSDANIDFYVNTFYLYDLPEQMKLLNLKETYQFYTEPFVASYSFPKNDYTLVEPLIQVNGYETQWFQDPLLFNRTFPTLDVTQRIGTGSGTTGPFTATLGTSPVLAGYTNGVGTIVSNVIVASIDINGDSIVLRDNGQGLFLDSNGAIVPFCAINYLTGVIGITFPIGIESGADVNCTYYSYSATRPTSVLFFEDTFTFRPIPDRAYIVNMNVYKKPTELTNPTDEPVFNAMWQLLAFGAAQKIFIDTGKLDQAQAYQPYLEEQMDLVRRRTLNQQDVQRVATLYSAQMTGQFSNNNYWW